jgi:hypothetical protein
LFSPSFVIDPFLSSLCTHAYKLLFVPFPLLPSPENEAT